MRQAKIADLRNHLSRYLQQVRGGEAIEVLDRDEPVARILPVGPPRRGGSKRDEEAWLKHLERQGVIRRGRGRLVPDILKPFPKGDPRPPSVLKALLEERRSGW